MTLHNEIDLRTDRPTPARMYDYFLHGKDNFPADRAAADQVIAKLGSVVTRAVVWENRRFLGRAVRFLTEECGVDQFIDIGAGLPSQENTHQVAQRVRPDARVLYVDYDPIVAAHGQQLLEGTSNTRIITADLREPGTILDHPVTRELIDFSRPVGVLFIAVFHFIPDSADPSGVISTVLDRLVPGSYLALSHLTTNSPSAEERDLMVATYANTAAPMIYRSDEEIAGLLSGVELVEPGLVPTGAWRPDTSDEPTRRMVAGVGRKA